jgi:VanZ family protein
MQQPAAPPAPRARRSDAVWALLAVAWAAFAWALLTTPSPPQVPAGWLPQLVQPWQDKIGHAGLFFVQAGLLERALRRRLGGARAFLVAAAFALALGGITEVRQRWVPNREADVLDFAADAGGALLYGALLGGTAALAGTFRTGATSAVGS